MSNDLRCSLPFGAATSARVLLGLASTIPTNFTRIQLVEACKLCQMYTTARCHEIHELSALGYPLVFADSGTTATQCTSTSLRRVAHSLPSKQIATCFQIQGRRLKIFCVAWARIAILMSMGTLCH